MNISIIQKFFLRKLLNSKNNYIKTSNTNKIVKIILLIDESHQDFKSKILTKIKEFGFKEENIFLLIYNQKLEKDKIYEFTTFSKDSFSNFGKIKSDELNFILKKSFDLLINFYENENLILDYVSQEIKADFKVGLSNSNIKNNQLIVNCKLIDINTYLSETIKYIKILNKL
jgi:hypothetical protein